MDEKLVNYMLEFGFSVVKDGGGVGFNMVDRYVDFDMVVVRVINCWKDVIVLFRFVVVGILVQCILEVVSVGVLLIIIGFGQGM